MNNLLLTIVFCFFSFFSFSQIWEDPILLSSSRTTGLRLHGFAVCGPDSGSYCILMAPDCGVVHIFHNKLRGVPPGSDLQKEFALSGPATNRICRSTLELRSGLLIRVNAGPDFKRAVETHSS